jgi:hypothetical protein
MRLLGFLLGVALVGSGTWLGVSLGRKGDASVSADVALEAAPALAQRGGTPPTEPDAAERAAWQADAQRVAWVTVPPPSHTSPPAQGAPARAEPQPYVQYRLPDGRLGLAESAASVPPGAQIVASRSVSADEPADDIEPLAAARTRSRADIARELAKLRRQNLADAEDEASWRATASFHADRARRETEAARDRRARGDADSPASLSATPAPPIGWR